jgi:hypothetical protein
VLAVRHQPFDVVVQIVRLQLSGAAGVPVTSWSMYQNVIHGNLTYLGDNDILRTDDIKEIILGKAGKVIVIALKVLFE